MNELIQNIVQRTGIGEDKARTAVEMVVSHLKGKLPAPISSQLDSYLSGGSEGGVKSSVTGMVSGLMNKDKTDAA
jgi:hypothetical protein